MEPQDILRLREEIDETVDQFAGRLGVSSHTIRNWEKGLTRPYPYFQVKLRKLRQEFDKATTKV